MSPPIVQSSTFAFESPEEMLAVFSGEKPGFLYTRYDNPTTALVEHKMTLLEGAEFSLLFASGLAAIHATLLAILPPGSLLLAGRELYGGTASQIAGILPRLGIAVERVDLTRVDTLEEALTRAPAAVLFETPTNPALRILDGPAITEKAKGAGALVIVDNTFATPVLQNPMEWGADLVVHSATKYLGGHSDLTLGAVAGRLGLREPIESARRTLGAVADPFACWLLNRGLLTLAVRVRAQCETACFLAGRLSGDRRLSRVLHPSLPAGPDHRLAARQMRGFGGIVTIVVRGGLDGAFAFMGGLRLVRLATSLGGAETIVSHPATSSHRMIPERDRVEAGIEDGMVRISVGLEDPEDILADLLQALDRVSPAAA